MTFSNPKTTALRLFALIVLLFEPAVADRVARAQGLEQRLQALFNSPVAANSTSSLMVAEVESGRVVAARNPRMPVSPASNMKLFTTAAGMQLLGHDFNFVTTVSMLGTVDPIGTLRGDVLIIGRGDPTISSRFHDGDATAVIKRWAAELRRQGVKTIGGNLILEYGYFDEVWVHPTWPKDQLVNWYEAPISALSIQEGCVMVRVLPTRQGQRAEVQLEPPNRYLTVENTCVTGGGRGVYITRKADTNTLIVRGNIPANSGPTEIFVTVLYPVHYFANVVHEVFMAEGIRVQGEVLLTPKEAREGWRTVTEHTTPLSVANIVINKKSQNFYAEQLLKTIGAEKKGVGSWEKGAQAVTEWLVQEVGVAPSEFEMIDGSGMSRFNRASSDSFIKLLRYMWNAPGRGEFVSSMPYSGEPDSRLRRRLNQPPYARSVYAKTGYLSGAIGLSGYVRGKSGRMYAFSFLFNNYRTGVWGVYDLQDAILKAVIENG
ncbi:MAG TPA: D-alanyl-D-alanine carboxypeptidase/D-alanyl-D-alanine-endopeptidase [Thermoanaerobaculia bacterium]|nr:D-alanyl-D-alanine carboxypeptidase/D-alanyl-D-alanine-endopeptidase [Thermoanaerobaculia bacterium]